MKRIELTETLKIGENPIHEVNVSPLSFAALAEVQDVAAKSRGGKPETALQRERIKHQAHFMSGKNRIIPDDAQLMQVSFKVIRQVIEALDEGQGEVGKLINDADGISAPILYQLGTPLKLKRGNQVEEIKELEFMASTYGQLEDYLACNGPLQQALELLKTVAKPVGFDSLMRLPGWAIDQITIGDGIGVMREVVPRF